MTVDLSRALKTRGIRLRCYKPGEHRPPCLQCARWLRADALASRIDPDGSALWLRDSSQSSGSIEQVPSRFSVDQHSHQPRP